MIEAALAEGEDAFRRLNEAAFINITGGSSADFSNITNGLLLVQGMAQDTIDALIATGQWELETIKLPMEAYDWTGNVLRKVKATGGQTVLKYKGASALGSGKSGYQSSGSTKKSGGGGGGGGSSKGDTEVEIMLDKMEQVQTIQDHTRSLYSGQASLYESRGELQGVIKYIEKEKGAIEDQNKTLEENIANIEAHMLKKQQEVAAMSKSAKGYEDAADDLDKLQKAHQDYTLQLIENQTELEELNKAIKEHQDAIREMQINLRETILQAIEDREALNDRILQGTIEVENEILDIIRERYEEERDMILEASEEKIDALEKEKNLLQEQLDLRKQQAEEEDKAARLKQLEAQLSRISADPTRKKEELELRKEIAELREEIAWNIADKEVEAQQKAIDEQITSVEDYMEYIENYYEDLFAHPTKLINEMKEVLRKSDEEIIQWLKEHNEEYAASTENTQRDMVNSWNDMLMDMHGQIKTYWDEVEQIIAGGDDTIIAFLKENSADYKAAGKLQAEAYVDEWRKQLDDLKKALKEVNAEISVPNYSTIDKGTGSSSGGGGGSGGSSSSKTEVYTVKDAAGNTYTSTRLGTAKAYASQAADRNPPAVVIDPSGKIIETYTGSRDSTGGIMGTIVSTIAPTVNAGITAAKTGIDNLIAGVTGNTVKKYATGGMADYTGPAWLDGTKSNPERILSPYQTKLFDEMIKVLQRIDTISVPGVPAYGETGKANSAYNVGDIIVNVDRLESDADYEEMAEKIFDTIMNRLNRTAPVGGIRMNR